MLSSKIKKTIQNAAKALTGYKHRIFIAQIATDYFAGNARKTEREMGWGRETIKKGLREIRTGTIVSLPRYKFWDIQVPRIHSPTRQVCLRRPWPSWSPLILSPLRD